MRSWTAELDGDSRLAMNPLLNPDYTALLLRLIRHVYQEQPLAASDPGLQPQQRPVLVDFKCLGLFVERLLFCIPAINKQGYAMRPTRAFPALDGLPFGGLFASFVGVLCGVPLSYTSPFSFCFFQGIPDATTVTSGDSDLPEANARTPRYPPCRRARSTTEEKTSWKSCTRPGRTWSCQTRACMASSVLGTRTILGAFYHHRALAMAKTQVWV